MDRKVGQPAQLARQILNVNARAPIYVGRVLASQECDLVRGHWCLLKYPAAMALLSGQVSISRRRP